jgi:glucan phosphorylase
MAQVALQLNDAHPSIGVAELLRILVDEKGLEWKKSWEICTKLFSFTNHTVIPETLEKWPVELFSNLLPRHLQVSELHSMTCVFSHHLKLQERLVYSVFVQDTHLIVG